GQPGGDAGQMGPELLAGARDDAQMALPYGVAAPDEEGLDVVRDRGVGDKGDDRPHAGPLRDRQARSGAPPLPDRDGLLERPPARIRARPDHRGGAPRSP